jgi:hypothetical protein
MEFFVLGMIAIGFFKTRGSLFFKKTGMSLTRPRTRTKKNLQLPGNFLLRLGSPAGLKIFSKKYEPISPLQQLFRTRI